MRNIMVACVVEGHGEVTAVPVLLRRIAAEIEPEIYLDLPAPYRVGRSQVLRPGYLENVVSLQADRVAMSGGSGGVLVLIDAEDSCPAELGPALQKRVMAARPDAKAAVVLANREYEAWFLAAAASLAGRRGFPEDMSPPTSPEAVRDAKGWLSKRRGAAPYKETADQAALTAVFDMWA